MEFHVICFICMWVYQLGVGNDVSCELFATHSEEELKTYKQLEWDLLPQINLLPVNLRMKFSHIVS